MQYGIISGMKVLFFGIFLILSIGILFFVVQIIKSPSFSLDISRPNPTYQSSKEVYTFVDVANSLSFDFPSNWQRNFEQKIQGFNPVFMANPGQYLAISSIPHIQGENINVDIDYFTDINLIQNITSQFTGTIDNIVVVSTKKLTFPNGLTGFIINYKNQAGTMQSSLYAYYAREHIIYAYAIDMTATSKTKTTFLQDADIVLQRLVVY